MQVQVQPFHRQVETPDALLRLLVEARDTLAKNPPDASKILDRAVALLEPKISNPSVLTEGAVNSLRIVSSISGHGAGLGSWRLREVLDAPNEGRQQATAQRDDVIRFGKYVIQPGSRSLLCQGRVVDLGSRAFDLLLVLVRARGTIVEKSEIFRCVWPSTHVEESNLRFQIACLRRALVSDRELIKTIPGRGYIFLTEAIAS